jgi:hypothetical protein
MDSILVASILLVQTQATTKPNLFRYLGQIHSALAVIWVWMHCQVFIKVVATPTFAMPITA